MQFKAGLDASKHMLAVTSETSPLASSDEYLAAFFMDDYIGGRYSSTSAVGGAVLSLAFGRMCLNSSSPAQLRRTGWPEMKSSSITLPCWMPL